jgi:catechol-2,3-dioxygenase
VQWVAFQRKGGLTMTRRVDTLAFHLAIAVRDLEKSRAFYQQLFAMTPSLETDDVVLLTTPARREQLALQRKPDATVDAATWSHHGVHFGFVVSEEVLGHSREAIRHAGGEVVAEGSRAIGPYLFFRDPDGYLVELFVDRGWSV